MGNQAGRQEETESGLLLLCRGFVSASVFSVSAFLLDVEGKTFTAKNSQYEFIFFHVCQSISQTRQVLTNEH